MKTPTISKAKELVKETGATSGILILFHEPTANYASASYGIDKEQCKSITAPCDYYKKGD